MRHAILFALFAAFFSITTSAPVQAQKNTPRLETANCHTNYLHPIVSCYNLIVPEDRTNPDSPEIRVAVVQFRTPSRQAAPDPVIYLNGGPGSDTIMQFDSGFLPSPFMDILAKRDVILIDQRGTGYSAPRLGCPEYNNMLYETLDEDLSPQEMTDLTIQVLTLCKDRLESRGINLAAYNSAENAADLEDLRIALGYNQWNLYGISYGTRLALTTMRDYPDHIRSVIIDSVLPPQVSLFDEAAANADRAFNTLFLNCTLDPLCNQQYPNLGTIFYQTVEQLNTQAGSALITHPVTDSEYNILINGDRLLQFTYSALYTPYFIELLPSIIYDAHAGNYYPLAQMIRGILYTNENIAMGMHFSVQCSEETVFTSTASIETSAADYPHIRNYLDLSPNMGKTIFAVCAEWTSYPPADIENQPVVSDIPTLIISGEYDPITPPHWGNVAASTLTNATHYELHSMGHGATFEDYCAQSILTGFLDTLAAPPESSCLIQRDRLAFRVIDNTIRMIPFLDSYKQITSVRPDNWNTFTDSIYMRDGADETMILYDIIPFASAEAVLKSIAEEYNIYIEPQAIETKITDQLLWQVYEFRQGELYVNAALAQYQDDTCIILLVSKQFDHDTLYQNVLIPAIEHLQILN